MGFDCCGIMCDCVRFGWSWLLGVYSSDAWTCLILLRLLLRASKFEVRFAHHMELRTWLDCVVFPSIVSVFTAALGGLVWLGLAHPFFHGRIGKATKKPVSS